MHSKFWFKNLKVGSNTDKNTLISLRKTECEGMDWFHLVQEDRYQRQILLNMIMNLWVHKKLAIFCPPQQLVPYKGFL
jgi:hypothetical protein